MKLQIFHKDIFQMHTTLYFLVAFEVITGTPPDFPLRNDQFGSLKLNPG